MNTLGKLFFTGLVLVLSGCALDSDVAEEGNSTVNQGDASRDTKTVEGSPSGPVDRVPTEWTDIEKKIFEAYVLFYPEYGNINLQGKRALMENAHLICKAYGEGYSRVEIQSVITGGAVTPQMSDDWMTLSVTYLCPEFFDLHR